MGFQLIDQGIQVPFASGPLTNQHRVNKLQKVTKEHKIKENGEDASFQNEPQKHHEAKKAFQHSEYMHQKRVLRANQVMSSPVISLTQDTTLDEAWEVICNYKFLHIPVLSQEKKLIGIVSDRDLLREAAIIGNIPWFSSEKSNIQKTMHLLQQAKNENTDLNGPENSPLQKQIQGIFRTRVLIASPDTDVREIAKIMIEEHIGSMPIVDEKESLVGIITRSDILRTIIIQDSLNLLI
ncbi:MAG: CBS domain-containing protein [Candidatus Brocadiaceae bacterium]|nr:CBS domain-containing protein [Candidatus Brocadiaceae bacterium]